MPRYFFHIHTGSDTAVDPDGTVLASVKDAVSEAVEDHLSFAIEALRRRQPLPYLYEIGVCDAEGRFLARVTFADAIETLSSMNGVGNAPAASNYGRCNRAR